MAVVPLKSSNKVLAKEEKSIHAQYQQRVDEQGLTLLPRLGLPEEVERCMLTFATGGMPYTTGHVISVDGGLLLPQFLGLNYDPEKDSDAIHALQSRRARWPDDVHTAFFERIDQIVSKYIHKINRTNI